MDHEVKVKHLLGDPIFHSSRKQRYLVNCFERLAGISFNMDKLTLILMTDRAGTTLDAPPPEMMEMFM